jgi:hypothetical protein
VDSVLLMLRISFGETREHKTDHKCMSNRKTKNFVLIVKTSLCVDLLEQTRKTFHSCSTFLSCELGQCVPIPFPLAELTEPVKCFLGMNFSLFVLQIKISSLRFVALCGK